MSLLRIELRRSPILPMLPLVALVFALLPATRHFDPVALWPTRSLDLQFTMQAFGPLAGGIGAWAAAREHRHHATDLVATTARSPWSRALLNWLAAALWATLFYLVYALAAVLVTSSQATWGSPQLWPLAVALAGILAYSAVGFAIGHTFPNRLVAPLTAIGLFVVLLAALTAGSRGAWGGWLAPVYPAIGTNEGLFWPARLDLAWTQLIFATGLLVTPLGAIGLRGTPLGFSRRAALAVTAAGLGLIVTAGTLASTGHVDQRGVIVPALHDAGTDRALTFQPVCESAPLTVCLHPAYSDELSALTAVANRVAAPVAGLPGVPTRIDPAPGDSPPRRSGPGAVALPAIVVHGDTIPAGPADAYASALALVLVAPPPSTPTPAERAVAVFLVRNAGRQPVGKLLRDPAIDAGAACVAAHRDRIAAILSGDLRCV